LGGDAYDYLVQARDLAAGRRPAESREAVDWALAHARPADTGVLVLAGMVLLMLGDGPAALTVGLRAAEGDPNDWEAQVVVADACRTLSRIPESLAAARRAVALAPDELEARVALWRALAEYRTLTGIPKEHRLELDATARRALELGADPGQFRAPKWWLPVLPAVAVGLLVPTAGGWVVGGVLAVMAAVAAALWLVQAHWSGTSGSGRLQSLRALARADLAGDPSRTRTAVINSGAFLPVIPFAATAFACAAGAGGRPWPDWLVAVAAAGALAVLYAAARAIRWWYGADFLRRDFLPSRFAAVQLCAAGGLIGTTLALSLASTRSSGWWALLFGAHFGWFLAALTGTLVALARERRRRDDATR
jgi:tetratricopeptide (TPR) repeat protein